LATRTELARKLLELEAHLKDHDQQIQAIFKALRPLMILLNKSRKIAPVKFEFAVSS
jgi:hypothetical protein